jgi:hypothetical protein
LGSRIASRHENIGISPKKAGPRTGMQIAICPLSQRAGQQEPVRLDQEMPW